MNGDVKHDNISNVILLLRRNNARNNYGSEAGIMKQESGKRKE